MTWKIVDSKAHEVDRFKIHLDKIIVKDGEEKPYSYIDFAKGVCILPITNDNKIVCLKQYRHTVKSWEWELPAGTIDGESPLDVAKKELEEETGYVAEHWLELGSFYASPGSTTEEIFLFAAAGLTETQQNLENSEKIELHELTMEEVKELVAKGEFKHGAGLAAILRYKFMTD